MSMQRSNLAFFYADDLTVDGNDDERDQQAPHTNLIPLRHHLCITRTVSSVLEYILSIPTLTVRLSSSSLHLFICTLHTAILLFIHLSLPPTDHRTL